MHFIRALIGISVSTIIFIFSGQAQNKYVGVKMCAMCHKTEKQGKQLEVWQKGKHAEAYKILTSARADSIAKAKGLKKPAALSPECLTCHVTGFDLDPNLLDKNFDSKDGVQCETCHGAGSNYKVITIMKDKKKAIAAGMTEYKDEAAIEKHCKTCHNEKSPVFKGFEFKEMWAKIKHPVPKAG